MQTGCYRLRGMISTVVVLSYDIDKVVRAEETPDIAAAVSQVGMHASKKVSTKQAQPSLLRLPPPPITHVRH